MFRDVPRYSEIFTESRRRWRSSALARPLWARRSRASSCATPAPMSPCCGRRPMAPPPPAGTPPTTTGGLAKLKVLYLYHTQITDAGCAHLASRLRSGALPALGVLYLQGISASDASYQAVYEARPGLDHPRGNVRFHAPLYP